MKCKTDALTTWPVDHEWVKVCKKYEFSRQSFSIGFGTRCGDRYSTYLQRVLVSRWQKYSGEEWNLRRITSIVDTTTKDLDPNRIVIMHENQASTQGQEAGRLE